MYAEIEQIKKFLPQESINQLAQRLERQFLDISQIELNEIYKCNGIIDAYMAFPAFKGYEKLGLRYLLDCIKEIRLLIKGNTDRFFDAVNKVLLNKESPHDYFELENINLEVKNLASHNLVNSYDGKDFNERPSAEEYKKIAVSEAHQALYSLTRWALYASSHFTEEAEELTYLHQLCFWGALNAIANSIAYYKAGELINNCGISENVFEFWLKNKEPYFAALIISPSNQPSNSN